MERTPGSLLVRLRGAEAQESWATFVKLYTPLLFHWARRLGLQAHDASDLVQDVFIILLRRLPEFDYDQHLSFRGWLHTVTLNRWRERRRLKDPLVQGTPAQLPELEEPDPAAAFWETEYREQLVQRALELIQVQFEPATWKAFWAVVVEEKPAAEVAQSLGLSVNAVYIARSRVLTRLRTELDGLLE